VAFSIKNSEVDRLARELVAATGESLTQAVETALRDRLQRVNHPRAGMAQRIDEIVARVHRMPVRDTRSTDLLIGYDENGLPT
jgi:antitoxin VapB